MPRRASTATVAAVQRAEKSDRVRLILGPRTGFGPRAGPRSWSATGPTLLDGPVYPLRPVRGRFPAGVAATTRFELVDCGWLGRPFFGRGLRPTTGGRR